MENIRIDLEKFYTFREKQLKTFKTKVINFYKEQECIKYFLGKILENNKNYFEFDLFKLDKHGYLTTYEESLKNNSLLCDVDCDVDYFCEEIEKVNKKLQKYIHYTNLEGLLDDLTESITLCILSDNLHFVWNIEN